MRSNKKRYLDRMCIIGHRSRGDCVSDFLRSYFGFIGSYSIHITIFFLISYEKRRIYCQISFLSYEIGIICQKKIILIDWGEKYLLLQKFWTLKTIDYSMHYLLNDFADLFIPNTTIWKSKFFRLFQFNHTMITKDV